jgi:hypothetical protein
MDTLAREPSIDVQRPERRAYDPHNLHPDDAEDRRHDDTTLDIDWDDIIASTQDDVLAGRYCFSTADYPTHEAGMKALWQWMCTLGKGDSDGAAGTAESDAPGP